MHTWTTNPERVGDALREALQVSLATQMSWREPYDSFNGWRGAIEDSRALVLQMTYVELDEARGFSIAELPLPVVVVNVKDAPAGRVFTLLHEFAHLALRPSATGYRQRFFPGGRSCRRR
jgi:Zn-dependent peptidase ImmA (M78 family)